MNTLAVKEKKRKFVTKLFFTAAFFIFGNAAQIFAHGGEDHGDEQPKATISEKGNISHTARLGAYEITFRHPFLEPDAATPAKLFITEFATNKPVENAIAAIEIESAGDGTVIPAVVEKTETAGSYNVKLPALLQGIYTIRAKLTYEGEIDTATFTNVEVAPAPAATQTDLSWARTASIEFVLMLVLALLGGLIYFVWHFAGGSLDEETVSA
jgi:hypothetical protein